MGRLEDKVCIVTGASAGIGRELVRSVDRKYEFDEIWIIARRKERLEELASECRNKVRPLAGKSCCRSCATNARICRAPWPIA